MINSAKKRALMMKPEQDLPWVVGFGWIRESGKWGLVKGVESAIDGRVE